jgi:NTP pyrophosphatase (non-canonical NTP hydrolase)
MRLFQEKVKNTYHERGYTDDLVTLALGLCEEAGEIGKAVNWYHNPLYIHNPTSTAPDSVEHELGDLLYYIASIANVLNIDLDELIKQKSEEANK